jgi:Nickel responsive protein SCO4226-like
MKNTFLFLLAIILAGTFTININAQNKSQETAANTTAMHRYVVERTFPNGLNIPISEVGKDICINVISTNAEDQVSWVQSYVSEDKKKTFCIYDAPSKDAIQKAAKNNKLPVDKITEVTVLDPYFYK